MVGYWAGNYPPYSSLCLEPTAVGFDHIGWLNVACPSPNQEHWLVMGLHRMGGFGGVEDVGAGWVKNGAVVVDLPLG